MAQSQARNKAQDSEAPNLKSVEQAQTTTGDDSGGIEQPQPSISTVARGRQMARTLWQATLGMTLTARRRSDKVFQRMVRKGAHYQAMRAEQQRHDHSDSDSNQGGHGSLKEAASERFHELEHSLENQFDRGRDNTLHWIGVPSRRDFEALEKRVDALAQMVAIMQQQLEEAQSARDASSDR